MKKNFMKKLKKEKIRQKGLSLLLIVAWLAMFSYGFFLPVSKVQAAGIDDVTVSLTDGSTSASSQVDVQWTPTTALANSDTITIYLGENTGGNAWTMTSVLTSDLGCADTGGTYAGASVNDATATVPAYVTITATTAGTGSITCSIGDVNDPANPSVVDGYEVSVVTNDDEGAGIAYVGDNNDVTATATVLPILNLTVSDNTVDLGVVLTTAVATQNHTISVGTNATNGATVKINADAALNNADDSWTNVTEDSTVTADTEGYGIAVTAGSGWTENGDFADDDTPIPTSATTLMTSAGAIDDSVTTTIAYRAAVSTTTPAGIYDQIVTYTAIADF